MLPLLEAEQAMVNIPVEIGRPVSDDQYGRIAKGSSGS
jgi:hypothetical protein